MEGEAQESVIYCQDPTCIFPLKKRLNNCLILPLESVTNKQKPCVVIANAQNIDVALKATIDANPAEVSETVITGRLARIDKIPEHLPRSTVLLPWCDDDKFADWILLLVGQQDSRVHFDWFFNRREFSSIREQEKFSVLIDALRRLEASEVHSIGPKTLAHRIGCSVRTLDNLCLELYGTWSGRLLRVWRLFCLTARCMRKEAGLSNGRRGLSPLSAVEGDFRRSLKRLLAMTYTELRLAAKKEHWTAVWMRRWWAQQKKLSPDQFRDAL